MAEKPVVVQRRLVGSAPVLLVRDVVASADYYRDKVGFHYDRFWGDPPCFCILGRDGYHLMLSQVDDPSLIAPNHKADEDTWDVYFWVDDADRTYAEFQERGATITSGLREQPHGCRELEIQDLDGYIIAFGQSLD